MHIKRDENTGNGQFFLPSLQNIGLKSLHLYNYKRSHVKILHFLLLSIKNITLSLDFNCYSKIDR